MNIAELIKGNTGPRWAHAVAYVILLGGFALTLYQRADVVFQFTNSTLEENRRHFDETPVEASVAVDGVGKVTLQYFPSDRCMRVFRPDTDLARWVTYDELQASSSSLQFVTQLVAAVRETCIPAEAHEDPPETSTGERREDMIQVHYQFEDGCKGSVWCHVAGHWCETNKDGTLRVEWDYCAVH
jgi:hypothetical protein